MLYCSCLCNLFFGRFSQNSSQCDQNREPDIVYLFFEYINQARSELRPTANACRGKRPGRVLSDFAPLGMAGSTRHPYLWEGTAGTAGFAAGASLRAKTVRFDVTHRLQLVYRVR